MGFAWKPLFGLGIANIFLIALERQLLSDSAGNLSTENLIIMSVINWIITIGTLLIMANVLGRKKFERPKPVPSPLANMGGD